MSIRINKFLSNVGYCSRRKADILLEEGSIYINNVKTSKGYILKENDKVYFKDKFIAQYGDENKIEEIILALNKPRGIVCTSSNKDKALNIVDYISYPTRVYPIGRLDKESQGLILLTNKGKIVNLLMKAASYHEKEYVVTLDKEFPDSFLNKMSNGVYLKELNVTTRKCKLYRISKNSFGIILTQGLNRQIRRMSAFFGYKVIKLERIRIMNINLDGIKYGEFRSLDKQEIKNLYKLL